MSKLIECLHRRDGGTVVTFDANENWPAATYHFKPILIGGGHAAEVKHTEHVDRFLSFPKSYRAVASDTVISVAVPSLTASTQIDGGDQGKDDGDDVWSAEKALSLPVAKILPMVKSWTPEMIREALDVEQAKEEPRETVIAKLTNALKGGDD